MAHLRVVPPGAARRAAGIVTFVQAQSLRLVTSAEDLGRLATVLQERGDLDPAAAIRRYTAGPALVGDGQEISR